MKSQNRRMLRTCQMLANLGLGKISSKEDSARFPPALRQASILVKFGPSSRYRTIIGELDKMLKLFTGPEGLSSEENKEEMRRGFTMALAVAKLYVTTLERAENALHRLGWCFDEGTGKIKERLSGRPGRQPEFFRECVWWVYTKQFREHYTFDRELREKIAEVLSLYFEDELLSVESDGTIHAALKNAMKSYVG